MDKQNNDIKEISKIQLPNGEQRDIKDEYARYCFDVLLGKIPVEEVNEKEDE